MGTVYSKTGVIVVRHTFRMIVLLTSVLRSTLREYNFFEAFLNNVVYMTIPILRSSLKMIPKIL